MHQPTWLSLLLVAGFLLSFFSLLGLLHINWLTRLLLLVPAMIGIALLYLPHQPVVTGIVLSFGFIMTFLVVFSMLSGTKH
jgi:hypothetical protein